MNTKLNTAEHTRAIFGVEGRAFARHVWPESTRPEHAIGLWSTQTWKASREYTERGVRHQITVEMRFDDNCRNGKHSFAITGDIRYKGERSWVSGGCIHEEIAKYFPELKPLIKWHLFDQTGPMHYVANTLYLAGDRDCWGLRKGEQRQIRNGRTGELAWIRKGADTKYHDGPEAPTDTVTLAWEPWMRTGEGKARQLDAARSVAVWPEATDAELCQEPEALKAALLARLPALIAAFRADMDACGFAWEAPQS